jgi:hypothetical protein
MRIAETVKAVEIQSDVDYSALSRDALEAMAAAGQEILEIHRILAKTGDNVVGELLRGYDTFYEWDHYPKGDVYDNETHGQYYYHAHPLEERFANEHGHFHTFIRPKGMPPGVRPANVPGAEPPKDPNDALSHLIAIAMDKVGVPFRLFTVNRWVTGEVWYTAADVAVLLDYFKIDHAQPSWPVNRWVTAMVRLFNPQIVELLQARDRTVEAWQGSHPEGDVYEDRDLELTSCLEISIDEQIRAVARALLERE